MRCHHKGRRRCVRCRSGTEMGWSRVRTAGVREHVLLGSPEDIPNHLQSARDTQSNSKLNTNGGMALSLLPGSSIDHAQPDKIHTLFTGTSRAYRHLANPPGLSTACG